MDINPSDRIPELERLIADLRKEHSDPESKARLEETETELEKLRGEGAADVENPPGESKEPAKRSAWERVQLARHPRRPHTLDYIPRIFTGFQEIHGDRLFCR